MDPFVAIPARRERAARGAIASLAALVVVVLAALMPASAAAMDEQATIVEIAHQHIGDKFRLGADGPTRFDCSGFVWFVFNTAHLGDRIGGKPLRARQFQKLFRERGLLFKDPSQARIGDLAFYGNPAHHSAIVTGFDAKGRPRITSALTIGVRETRYNTLDVPFDSFAHVGLGLGPEPTPSPSPSAAPTASATPTASPTPTAPPTQPPAATPTALPTIPPTG